MTCSFSLNGTKKALSNRRKHGVSFELASSVFSDPGILSSADLAHSETEERWFSIPLASNGVIRSVAYLWNKAEPGVTRIRLITARKATSTELRCYLDLT